MSAPADPSFFVVRAICMPESSDLLTPILRATLDWQAVPGAVSYRLEEFNGTEGWVLVGNFAETTFFRQLIGYIPGTNDQFRVRAENGDGASAWTTLTYARPARAGDYSDVDGPAGLIATAVAADMVAIQWTDQDNRDASWLIVVTDSEENVTTYSEQGQYNAYRLFGLRAGRDYSIRVKAVVQASDGTLHETPPTDALHLTIPATPVISSVPREVFCTVGQSYAINAKVYGLFEDPTITVDGGPAVVSVEVGAIDPDGGYKFTIYGTAMTAGIYDAVVNVGTGGYAVRQYFSIAIRFYVSGGLFIAPMAVDVTARDLQIDVRTRQVTGYYFQEPGSGLVLIVGDDATLYVFFKDQGRFVGDGISEITLRVRLKDQWNSPELLSTTVVNPAGTQFGTALGFPVSFRTEGPVIDRVLHFRNNQSATQVIENALLCDADITYVRLGKRQTSKPFAVTLLQDLTSL